MAIQLGDGTTNNTVDPTSRGIIVQNPKTVGQAGFAHQSTLVDAGTVTGSVLARALKSTPQGREEISYLSPLFTDTFNYAAQDTARWNLALTTFTQSFAAGYTVFNSGNVTTASATAAMRTYATWPVPTEGALVARFFGFLTQIPQANCVVEFGPLFASGTSAPTDGAFFRYDATGTLKGVINYNGTELTTSAITAPSAGASHSWVIIVDETHVEFWIDNVLQAQLYSPAGNGQPFMSSSIQILIRMYHTATPPTLANQLKISDVDLWQTDGNVNRPIHFERAGAGMNAIQGVSGMTMGSTANYANSANPAAAVPTNTTAALGTGLGGQFWETATLAVNTDGIISSFQVPVATVNLAGRKLVITGIHWMTMVQTVLAGGPFVYQHGVALGHTSLSLATAEGAAAKAPRRLALGLSTFASAAAVGTLGFSYDHQFTTPLVVNQGEFIAFIVKNIGTVGSSGTIAHSIHVDAHWE
jgi:hypothetical protein